MTSAVQCRSCGARIRWALTVNGRAIPLDIVPRADGNLVIERDKHGDEMAVTHQPLVHAGKERFVSHFATCRDAASWRNREGRAG